MEGRGERGEGGKKGGREGGREGEEEGREETRGQLILQAHKSVDVGDLSGSSSNQSQATGTPLRA